MMKTSWICLIAGTVLLPAISGRANGLYAADLPARNMAGEICITLDDLPVVRVHNRTERLQITEAILSALQQFDAKAAGFVVGNNVDGDWDILKAWLDAGHVLGNHTYSHPDLNEVAIDQYVVDVEKGQAAVESLLVRSGQTKRYFRYPYLHYGCIDTIKSSAAHYLKKKGYVPAHVSVDTEDYAFNLRLEKLTPSSDSLEYANLRDEYVAHILEQVKGAETLSDRIFGRQVRQILLLHANRLNGYFLADLLRALRDRGYTFISLDEALADPAYSVPESYTGPKGLSYLERLTETAPGGSQAGEK